MEHPFLGRVEFDFTKPDGNTFDTIVFAGENGTGKTVILNTLTSITNIEFWTHTETNYPAKPFKAEIDYDGSIITLIAERTSVDGQMKVSLINKDGIINDNQANLASKHLQMILSNVEINFTHTDITVASTEDLDSTSSVSQTIANTADLPSKIAQLFVDINALDSTDTANYVKSHPNSNVPEDYVDIRMKRFSRAFAIMFSDYLRFHDIKNIPRDMNSPSKGIFFIKNGKNEVELNSLSSGEKQVIYRSAFLLRDREPTKGCPVLIDEPEISMHPKWQEKVYRFFQALFTEDDVQKSQIFMATHSDHVLKSALEDENALIVKLDTNVGEGTAKAELMHRNSNGAILPHITLGEVKWRVFDMPTIDFHIDLYSYIQEHLVVDSNGNRIVDAAGNLTVANVYETDDYLNREGNTSRPSSFTDRSGRIRNYYGLTTYIRNCINHPDCGTFSEHELKYSIAFMIGLATT